MMDEVSELRSVQFDSWEERESPQMESSRLAVTVPGTNLFIRSSLETQLSSRSREFGIQGKGGGVGVEEWKWEKLSRLKLGCSLRGRALSKK